jgi:FixJ family two-component response regulator
MSIARREGRDFGVTDFPTLAYGAFDYISKPFDLNYLSDVVDAAVLWQR